MFVMTYKMEEEKRTKNRRMLQALLAVIVTIAGAVIASFLTDTSSAWYQNLTLSPIQPPPWVFGAVWTTLYVLLAISFAYALTQPRITKSIVIRYILNIILNALWSPVFFIFQQPAGALVIMVVLIVNLLSLMISVRRIRLSFFTLIPYIAWLSIATILNVSIIILN